MTRIFKSACVTFCALFALQSCGTGENTEVEVYGGRDVKSGPISRSVVALRKGLHTYCTATILSESVAITAGHCTAEWAFPSNLNETQRQRAKRVHEEMNESVVAFGINSTGIAVQTRPVVAMEAHEGWKNLVNRVLKIVFQSQNNETPSQADLTWLKSLPKKPGWHDIALVHFSGGLPPGIKPARLATAFPYEREALVLAGFGVSEVGRRDSGVLRWVSSFVETASNEAGEFTVEGQKGSGICKGDSGGPAFSDINGDGVVIGVVSRSTAPDGCQTNDHIYTDVFTHLTWVQETSQKMTGAPLPSF